MHEVFKNLDEEYSNECRLYQQQAEGVSQLKKLVSEKALEVYGIRDFIKQEIDKFIQQDTENRGDYTDHPAALSLSADDIVSKIRIDFTRAILILDDKQTNLN